MAEDCTIYEALAKARLKFRESAEFRKVKAEGLRFEYLPVEQAKPHIELATATYGITIIPVSLEIDPEVRQWDKVSQQTMSNTRWTQLRATVRFLLACGPREDQRLTMDIVAEAMDNSDKAISKIYTMAYKSMIKIVFGFSESADDDADLLQDEIPTPKRKAATPVKKETKAEPKPAPVKETKEEPTYLTASRDELLDLLEMMAALNPAKVEGVAMGLYGDTGKLWRKLGVEELRQLFKEVTE